MTDELEVLKTTLKQLGQDEYTWSPGFNSLYDVCNRAIAIAEASIAEAFHGEALTRHRAIPMNRAIWDETWLRVCDAIAMRSKCFRRQIGAAIVTRDQELVAVGFNGAPPGYPEHGSDCRAWCARASGTNISRAYNDCPSVHSEMNALVRAGRAAPKSRTLYVSSAVCMDCAKVAPSAGIGRVVMRVDHEYDWHRDPNGVTAFLETCGLEVVWASA